MVCVFGGRPIGRVRSMMTENGDQSLVEVSSPCRSAVVELKMKTGRRSRWRRYEKDKQQTLEIIHGRRNWEVLISMQPQCHILLKGRYPEIDTINPRQLCIQPRVLGS